MSRIELQDRLLKYARSPMAPHSVGIVAILNGVFAPFAYVPLSSFSGRMLVESVESISLFNRGTGALIIALSLLSFVFLVKKKYLTSMIFGSLSWLIVIIEMFRVAVLGVSGSQYGSIYDPTMFLPHGPVVVYDLTVRARLGSAMGPLLGGHISFFFAVLMGRRQAIKMGAAPQEAKRPHQWLFVGLPVILLLVAALLYIMIITYDGPIAETHMRGILNRD